MLLSLHLEPAFLTRSGGIVHSIVLHRQLQRHALLPLFPLPSPFNSVTDTAAPQKDKACSAKPPRRSQQGLPLPGSSPRSPHTCDSRGGGDGNAAGVQPQSPSVACGWSQYATLAAPVRARASFLPIGLLGEKVCMPTAFSTRAGVESCSNYLQPQLITGSACMRTCAGERPAGRLVGGELDASAL